MLKWLKQFFFRMTPYTYSHIEPVEPWPAATGKSTFFPEFKIDIPMPKIKDFGIETFTYEQHDDKLYLCANDLHASIKLAEFDSMESLDRFKKILTGMSNKSYAQGQLGI